MSARLYSPRPLVRKYLLREAEKARQTCAICQTNQPCQIDDGRPICGPCHYGSSLLQRETPAPNTCCNDCAFRRGSPERDISERHLHHDCLTQLDFVKQYSDVFYCHKPFLEPEQEWGYDPKTNELIPLYGEHWRACAGWWAEMRRQYGIDSGSRKTRQRSARFADGG